MKSNAILCGALLLSCVVASAQEKTPLAEVGLSYSYMRVNPGGTLSSFNATLQ